MIQSPPPLGPNEYVTWVKVEPEIFDIAGILASSLGFTLLLLALALVLGSVVGAGLILRRRRTGTDAPPSVLLET